MTGEERVQAYDDVVRMIQDQAIAAYLVTSLLLSLQTLSSRAYRQTR